MGESISASRASPDRRASKEELGTCPFCGSAIPAGAILVEYGAKGETRVFAECFECKEPVKPQ